MSHRIVKADKKVYTTVRLNRERNSGEGSYHLISIDRFGRLALDVALPGRSHGVVISPKNDELVVFARRPGYFFQVRDRSSGRLIFEAKPPEGHCFTGHGCYSGEGAHLYVSLNRYEDGMGVIAQYYCENWKSSPNLCAARGMGLHEIVADVSVEKLVVANGGVHTHPDYGRAKLNLDTMSPTLGELDFKRFEDEAKAWSLSEDLHQLSIRHLAFDTCGEHLLGLQYYGHSMVPQPILAYKNMESLVLIEMPENILKKAHSYAGSVVIDCSGALGAVSCPRGGMVVFVHREASGYRFFSSYELTDVCGLAAGDEKGQFYLSSGKGDVVLYDSVEGIVLDSWFYPFSFDNHMIFG
tara:strand:- start:143 stop:1204 length:1062 start_codon:yes stop_codon:yes gene_type:complete